jgi:redox-sensitive bicupin YhaK (pirin superfamily)
LLVALLQPGQETAYDLGKARYAWLQVAKGAVSLDGQELRQGDGAAVSDEPKLSIQGLHEAEVLLFDLA